MSHTENERKPFKCTTTEKNESRKRVESLFSKCIWNWNFEKRQSSLYKPVCIVTFGSTKCIYLSSRQKQTSLCVKYTWTVIIIRATRWKGWNVVSCKTEDRIMHIDRITRHTQIFYVHMRFSLSFAFLFVCLHSANAGLAINDILSVEYGKLRKFFFFDCKMNLQLMKTQWKIHLQNKRITKKRTHILNELQSIVFVCKWKWYFLRSFEMTLIRVRRFIRRN